MSENPAHVSGRTIFTMTKKHCRFIILIVEGACSYEGTWLAFIISGQRVLDPYEYTILPKALLSDNCLIWWVTRCCSIMCYGVSPQNFSWLVGLHNFRVWVHHGLCNRWLGRDDALDFSDYMESTSGCHNQKWCFEYKCRYSILQLLVKVSPLGSSQVIPVAFR